ncbi:DUF3068 domain-containing protein [Micromonospora sp. WMMA1363]|uniref:DUF3068 domain-containing protein n=1 Tax=Micromonospora sp. WMMA1363 TaxID=3053985 RepID=UPI00259CDC60|nr:DUF3068 domain-containing protein [Micromonospora sp. WMMA1363]MDM4719405.1 DUF3068 domain-containing protein [Micromonospora sp. WMMA1363]
MSRRVVGIALAGAGLVGLLAGLGLAFGIAPTVTRIPVDLAPTESVTEASGATVVHAELTGERPSIEIVTTDLRATTRIESDAATTATLAEAIRDDAVVWNVFQQTTRVDTGQLVSAVRSAIALDRTSGAAVDWSGQCRVDGPAAEECQPGTVRYSGQLYRFPFDTERTTYQYYDSDLGEALPIHYRGTETIEGLQAYRFEQVVDERPVRTSPQFVGALVARFAPGATTGSVTYRNHRTVWVEPVTGTIVGVREEPHRTLVPDVGQPVVLLDARFEFAPETLRRVTDDAASGRQRILFVRRYLPAGLVLVGLVGLAVGALVVRRTAARDG